MTLRETHSTQCTEKGEVSLGCSRYVIVRSRIVMGTQDVLHYYCFILLGDLAYSATLINLLLGVTLRPLKQSHSACTIEFNI